ncbi:MAG TPA: tRNA pseudouridine(55) synthase TruB [Solirubrobacteraceae bacterium]|nr:tRNA pseudouridine(55) synthase TruB [Solirubrobacteraceae bacterium]
MPTRTPTPMDGVLLADKPSGVTSHDVVAAVRRRLSGARTGHAGTLDPFATGLLLILVGRATRVQRFLMALPKTYLAVARFGAVSSTQDPDGEITVTGTPPPERLELRTGTLRQRPPAHSAVRVAGERAYRRARRGETFELPEREIVVYRFEERWRDRDRVGLEVECSSGTYVRSLVAALGDAYCEELRRTRIGAFDVRDAGSPADGPLEILSLGRALDFLPAVHLEPEQARRALHGQPIPAPVTAEPPVAAPLLLVDDEGPIAVAEPRAGAAGVEYKPAVVLRG